MKFHIMAAVLLGGIITLLYFLLAGFRDDLQSARPQIEKESVERVSHMKKKKEDAGETTAASTEIFNQNALTKEEPPKPLPVKKEVKDEKAKPDESIERLQGQDYWCQQISVKKDLNPVRCEYPDACYSCQNSDIIPPEVSSATPFCKDGTRPERYSVECCPSNISGGQVVCPSLNECMQAENVPDSFCTCNNRPDCRYVAIGKEVQCVCIQ